MQSKQNTTFFSTFETDFCSKSKNSTTSIGNENATTLTQNLKRIRSQKLILDPQRPFSLEILHLISGISPKFGYKIVPNLSEDLQNNPHPIANSGYAPASVLWISKQLVFEKNVAALCFMSLITNEKPVTILQAFMSLPRHIRKDVLIRSNFASDFCTLYSSWLPAISQRIEKMSKDNYV